MIYRAKVTSTPDANSMELVTYLEQWITAGSAGLTISGIRLNLDPSCNVTIESFDAPICSGIPTPNEMPTTTLMHLDQQTSTLVQLVQPTPTLDMPIQQASDTQKLPEIIGIVVAGVIVIAAVITAIYIFDRIRHYHK